MEPSVDYSTEVLPNGKMIVTMLPTYNMGSYELDRHWRICEMVRDAFVNGLAPGLSEYQRIQSAYEYIVRNCTYDINAPDDQNMLSVFENGVSTCAGYATI